VALIYHAFSEPVRKGFSVWAAESTGNRPQSSHRARSNEFPVRRSAAKVLSKDEAADRGEYRQAAGVSPQVAAGSRLLGWPLL